MSYKEEKIIFKMRNFIKPKIGKTSIFFLLFFVLLASVATFAHGATKTWDDGGADSNWNTAANWDPDGVPGVGDDVVFDGSTTTNTCTVNVDTADRLGSFTIQSDYDAANITVNGQILTDGLVIQSGTLTTSKAFNFGGDVTLSGDASINQTGEWTVFLGSADKTVSKSGTGSITLAKLEENSDSGAKTILNTDVTVDGDNVIIDGWDWPDGTLELASGVTLTITDGDYDASNTGATLIAASDSTVKINATDGWHTVTTGGTDTDHDFGNFHVAGGGSNHVALSTDGIKVNGTFTVDSSTEFNTSADDDCTVEIGGDVTINGTYAVANNATTTITGSGTDWDSSSGVYWYDSGNSKTPTLLFNTTGTSNFSAADNNSFYNLTHQGGADIVLDTPTDTAGINVDGVFTMGAGVGDFGDGSGDNHNVYLNNSSSTTNPFVFNGGTISIGDLVFKGSKANTVIPSGTYNVGELKLEPSSDTTFDLGGNITLTQSGATSSLRIYGNANHVQATLDTTANNYSITCEDLDLGFVNGDGTTDDYWGKLIANDSSITVNNNLNFNVPGSELDADTSDITIGGNFNNSAGGTFTYDTSEIIFDDNTKISTVSGDNTFYDLTSTTSSKALVFADSSTQTIASGGTLNLNGGSAGSEITLDSQSAGTQWNINCNDAQTVQYVSVIDSDASSGSAITANDSVDRGNNDNWTFGNVTRYWVGAAGGDWDDDSNWSSTSGGTAGADYPDAGDTAIFDGSDTDNCTLDADVAVAVVDIQSGYTGKIDANGNNITVSSTLDVDNGELELDANSDLTVNGALTVNGGTLDAVNGTIDANNSVTVSSGALLAPNNSFNVAGDFTIGASGTFTKGTGTLIFDGDLTFTDNTSGQNLGALEIGASPDTTTLDSDMTVDSLTINEGDILITNGYDITVTGDLTVAGTLDASDGAGGTTTLNVGGDFTVTSTGTLINVNNKMSITKDANKKEVTTGEVVTYTIKIENDTDTNFTSDVTIEDTIPGGFKYISDSAQLDGSPIANPTGNRPLSFNIGIVDKDATKTLRYQLVVGSGVTFGDYENSAVAKTSGGAVASNTSKEVVKVVPDPLFDLGTVIGKVFLDKDEDGVQDKGEPGIASVNIVTEDGAVITTDQHGKYHLKAISPGRHIFRIDESTLPENYYLTTDKAVIVDITEGLLQKVNFGVNTKQQTRVKNYDETPIRIIKKKEKPTPTLNVSLYPDTVTTEVPQDYTEEVKSRYEFRIFTNTSLFIEKWKLEIIDTDTKHTVKAISGTQNTLSDPVYWDGKTDRGRALNPEHDYVYKLTVEDSQGNKNTTVRRPLDVKEYKAKDTLRTKIEEEKESYDKWIKQESKTNALKQQNIKIEGDTVLIKSEKRFEKDIKEVETKQTAVPADRRQKVAIKVDDTSIPVQAERDEDIEQEIIIPEGSHRVVIESEDDKGAKKQYEKNVKVKDNYLFFVALGDAKMGYTFHSGSIEPIKHEEKYREGFWEEGKLAYFLKGKIKGKYLITSSLDTDRDKKELFRNLDEDKYYPVYGDASTVDYKAGDTQGALYLLIEWNKSDALWGNYKTGFNETEFAQFNRTLYGAKIDYESVSTTEFGSADTKLVVFSAKAQQRAAHNEFTGTGGSLFYLKNKDVTEGSETIKIQVRDQITGLVLAEETMTEGSDYEIDYDAGRIIFWKPVSSIAQSSSIIKSHVLDGNPVYLIVDYEYDTKDKFDENTYGARVKKSITDYVEIGGTYVNEKQPAEDYKLAGSDITIHVGENTTLKAEYAQSDAEQVGSFVSKDGGLSFTQIQTDEELGGSAYGVSATSYLLDSKLGLKGYYKKIEKEFSSTSSLSQQGKELTGGQITYDVSDNTRVKLQTDRQKLIDSGNEQTSLQTGAEETKTTSFQIAHTKDKLKLTGEYRHQDVEEKIEQYDSETNKDEQIIAAEAKYQLREDTLVSLRQQATLEGEVNNQTSLGVERKINDYFTVSGEQTIGTKGGGTTLGAIYNVKDKYQVIGDYTFANYSTGDIGDQASLTARAEVEEGKEVYHSYTMTEEPETGRKYAAVFGTKEKIADDLEFTMENERASNEDEYSNTNIFGLSGKVNEKVAANFSFERGTIQDYDGDEYLRRAGSLGVSYVDGKKLKASSKVELRLDEGQEDKRQYLIHNAAEYKYNPDTTLFAKAYFSQSDNNSQETEVGLYKEFVAGLAYRPLDNDQLNMLAKYSFIQDDSPSSQDDISDIEKESAHVLATEFIYDLTDNWQLSEKVALRVNQERVQGFEAARTKTWLNVNRLNYRINRDWQVAGEYRFLAQQEADDSKQGALVEVLRNIGDYVQVGVGYNFTDFSDDLTDLDYTAQGPYIRITGKLYDRSPEEKARARKARLEKQIEEWAWQRVLTNTAKKGTRAWDRLYSYYAKAEKLKQQGDLEQARQYYRKIVSEGQSIYIKAEEYVKERIELENKLKGDYDKAMEYYESGRLKQAKELFQEIIQKAQGGIK